MIQRDETVVELRTVQYETVTPDGTRLAATVDESGATLRYEPASGFVTATYPTAALPALSALVAALIADAVPTPVVDDPATDPTDTIPEEPA